MGKRIEERKGWAGQNSKSSTLVFNASFRKCFNHQVEVCINVLWTDLNTAGLGYDLLPLCVVLNSARVVVVLQSDQPFYCEFVYFSLPL